MIVNTGGVAQQWRVSNVKIATGTLVTIKFENSEMIVDESWFVFDANSGSLLQRLGFFGDMALNIVAKRKRRGVYHGEECDFIRNDVKLAQLVRAQDC